MEHVSEALYQAAAVAVFVLAFSLLLLDGRAVDGLIDCLCEMRNAATGNVEACVDE